MANHYLFTFKIKTGGKLIDATAIAENLPKARLMIQAQYPDCTILYSRQEKA